MKIAIIAANGKSGQALVKAALEHGHYVRAGVHGKHTLPKNDHLEIIRCNAMNSADVSSLVSGSDVVVSLIGHVKKSPNYLQSIAITNALTAMKRSNINRIASLTGTGARMPGDKPDVIDLLLNAGVKSLDSKRVVDGIRHLEILRNSSVDWTVLRVLKLTSGRSRPFHLSRSGPAELFSSRAEVAEAILHVIETDSYKQQAPVLTRGNR